MLLGGNQVIRTLREKTSHSALFQESATEFGCTFVFACEFRGISNAEQTRQNKLWLRQKISEKEISQWQSGVTKWELAQLIPNSAFDQQVTFQPVGTYVKQGFGSDSIDVLSLYGFSSLDVSSLNFIRVRFKELNYNKNNKNSKSSRALIMS